MAVYDITFTVGRDTVTPNVPQRCGVFGDKGQAIVRFAFEEGFSFGAEYQYRIELTDGAGMYDVTELMFAENGMVSFEIPEAWTTPGIAAVRLVAVELDEELNEAERWHSLPAFLCFDQRDNGEQILTLSEFEWRNALAKAQKAAETAAADALATSTDAQFAGECRDAVAADALQVAENTAAVVAAAQKSEESAESANGAALAAEAFCDRAEAAAQSAVGAKEDAISAEKSAAEATGAANHCDTVRDYVDSLVGVTAEIKATLGVV